jgi:hypothetical protein
MDIDINKPTPTTLGRDADENLLPPEIPNRAHFCNRLRFKFSAPRATIVPY